MSLRDIVDIAVTIKVNDKQSFDVRGLSTQDLAILSVDYDKNLTDLFSGNVEFSKMIKDAPLFAAKIIAIAADDPEGLERASKLVFGVQAKALKEIYDLTFPDEDFLGELLGQLTDALLKLQEKLVIEKPQEPKEKKPIGKKTLSKQSST